MKLDQTMLMMQTLVASSAAKITNAASSKADVSNGLGSASDSQDKFRDMLDKKQQGTDETTDSRTEDNVKQPQDPQKVQETGEGQQSEDSTETEIKASELLAVLNALGVQQPVQDVQVVEPEQLAVVETVANVAESAVVQEQAVPDDVVLTEVQEFAQVMSSEPVEIEADVKPEMAEQPQEVQEAVPEIQSERQTETAENQMQQQAQTDTTGDTEAVQVSEDTRDQDVQISVEQPVFGEVESTPIKVADAPVEVDTTKPDMVQDMADVVQANLTTVGDKVQIRLNPENLGEITVELSSTNGKIGLVIHAANPKTVELLSQHASELGALMENRTGREAAVQVQQNQQSEQPNDGRQNQQQQEQQTRQQRRQPQGRDEHENFIQQLRLGLIDLDVH